MEIVNMIVQINDVIQQYMKKMGINTMSADEAAQLVYNAGIIRQYGPKYGFAFREFIREVRDRFGYDMLFSLLAITQSGNREKGRYKIHAFEAPSEEEIVRIIEDKTGRTIKKSAGGSESLPDYLQDGLDVVFVGTSVGEESARRGKYYANPTNCFWDLVNKSTLVGDWIGSENCHFILEENCGLTDLAKKKISSSDNQLTDSDFDIEGFLDKIKKYKPQFVAFNGKRAFREVFGYSPSSYGLMKEIIGESKVYVLPSSSGADASMTYKQKLEWYKKLKSLL